MKIQQFVEEEVERQGFRRKTAAFHERVAGMMMAWGWAIAQARDSKWPSEWDVLAMGKMIEPYCNSDGYRQVDVWVGGHKGAIPAVIPSLMRDWALDVLTEMSADEAYLRFERIHPFVDGNGRTGKIIHNWLLGSLWKPVLVKDYFGGGVP